MVKMLRRMFWRQLRADWLLLVAIAGMMVIGITVFVGLRSSHRNLRRAQIDYYRRTRFADFWIRLKRMPRAEVARLHRFPGIRSLADRIWHYATIDLPDVEEPINALVLSTEDYGRGSLNRLVLRQGSRFTRLRPNEVIVVEQFARAHGIRPGQWIDVTLNERKQRLYVVGTAISSEFTYLLGPGSLVPDPKRFGVLFVKREFAEDVFDFDGSVNELFGRWSLGDAVLHRVWMGQLEHRLEPFGVLSKTQRKRQVSHQFLDGEIAGLGVSATVLPTVFLVAAALVLNVLMTRAARRQRQVIGTLKALGYEDAALFTHFLKMGAAVGLGAGIAGSVAGYAVSAGMTRIYRDYFEFPRLVAGVYWDIYAWGLVISVVCAIAGSWQGARSLYRLVPAEAMRAAPPRRGGAVWLENIRVVWRWLDTSWRLAVRGLLRQRFRTFTSLFATSVSAALLTAGLLMVHTIGVLVDFQFRQLSVSDGEIVLENERGADVIGEVRRLPGIRYVEPVYDLPCTLRHGPYEYRTSIMGLAGDARLTRPQTLDGATISVPSTGLVVNRRLADILQVRVGDLVEVRPVRGDRTVRRSRIRAIADGFLGVTAYADIGHTSRLAGESLAVSRIQFLSDGDAGNDHRRNRQLKDTPVVSMTLSRHDLIASLEETIVRNMLVFMVVLVGFSGTVFLGSLVNASLISLSERVREVATLRAIGYSPWRVGGLFLRETALVGAIGTVCGLPMGYGLMWLSILPYRTNDLFRIPLATAPWVWWSGVGFAVLFVLGAHAIVQFRIHRLDFREVLNVRE